MKNKLSILIVISLAVLACTALSYALSREAEAAAPLQPTPVVVHYVNPVKPNPNPGRVLNRTVVSVSDRNYEHVTLEPVLGVICVTVAIRAMRDEQPSISCVTR